MKIRFISIYLLLSLWGLAFAQQIPILKGYVNDYAGFLAPREVRTLEVLLQTMHTEQNVHMAILTVASLEDQALEDVTIKIAQAWGLGTKGEDYGLLLFLTRQDRAVRLEVGMGLEGFLTDAMAGRIVDQIMVPQFRQGLFYKGMHDAIQAVAEVTAGEIPTQLQPRAKTPIETIPEGIIIFVVMALIFGISAVRAKYGRKAGAFTGGTLMTLAVAVLLGLGFFSLIVFPIGMLMGGASNRSGPSGHRSMWGGVPRSGGWSGRSGGGFSGGGFSGRGGSFGGGGASGRW
jgi:uncharacterized protein